MKLILDGFNLMIIGMGGVFIFLMIMIGLMGFVAKLVAPFAHLLETPTQKPRVNNTNKTQKIAKDSDKNLIAAAIAAVHQHRNRQ